MAYATWNAVRTQKKSASVRPIDSIMSFLALPFMARSRYVIIASVQSRTRIEWRTRVGEADGEVMRGGRGWWADPRNVHAPAGGAKGNAGAACVGRAYNQPVTSSRGPAHGRPRPVAPRARAVRAGPRAPVG